MGAYDMTTIREIAEIAGVSSATVSKVLNGKDQNISSETRKRILNIAEKKGYIPNGIAKSLRIRNTKTLGLIIPDVTNLFFSEVAKGIEDAAANHGYSLILCNTDNKETKERTYIKILQEKKVDGLIITASHSNLGDQLDSVTTPVVLVDRDVKTIKKVGRVTVDNVTGGRLAAEKLIKSGCSSIVHITAELDNKPAAERHRGFTLILEERGIPLDKSGLHTGYFNVETGYQGIMELSKRLEFDGVFCGNDLIAIGAIKALRELGKNVPTDVSVIGFDDIALSKYVDPPLTTIRQPIYKLGESAVMVLLGMIDGGTTEQSVVLQPELIERMSCR